MTVAQVQRRNYQNLDVQKNLRLFARPQNHVFYVYHWAFLVDSFKAILDSFGLVQQGVEVTNPKVLLFFLHFPGHPSCDHVLQDITSP